MPRHLPSARQGRTCPWSWTRPHRRRSMTGNLTKRLCAVPSGAMLPLTFVTAACSGWAGRPVRHLSRPWPGSDGEPDTLPINSMTNWLDRCARGSKTTSSTNGRADSSLAGSPTRSSSATGASSSSWQPRPAPSTPTVTARREACPAVPSSLRQSAGSTSTKGIAAGRPTVFENRSWPRSKPTPIWQRPTQAPGPATRLV